MAHVLETNHGARYATKLLPGFELPLADLFRVCDRYKG